MSTSSLGSFTLRQHASSSSTDSRPLHSAGQSLSKRLCPVALRVVAQRGHGNGITTDYGYGTLLNAGSTVSGSCANRYRDLLIAAGDSRLHGMLRERLQ
ncbi:hypothetical protein M3J09_004132 [Ascochyta lentis]